MGGHVIYQTKGDVREALWTNVRVARTFFQRLVGLLRAEALDEDQCLMIQPCSSVHTIGMKMNIDVIFLDRAGMVTKVERDVRPFRFLSSRKSCMVIETKANSSYTKELEVGDKLYLGT